LTHPIADLLAPPDDAFRSSAERVLRKNLGEVVELHRRLLEAPGGAPRIRDIGALDSVAQPKAAFGGNDLYPTLVEKAAAPRSSTATSAAAMRRWRRSSF
jgi:hypothetical protein